MSCAMLLVLLGIALVAFSQRHHPARQDQHTTRPACRPASRAMLRLLFDLAVLPFQALVIVFAQKNTRNRQAGRRRNR